MKKWPFIQVGRGWQLLYGLWLLSACAEWEPGPKAGDLDQDGQPLMSCVPGEAPSCDGHVAVTCVDGFAKRQDCAHDRGICLANQGCVLCFPGNGSCDGETTLHCSDDGMTWERGEVCRDDLHCSHGTCADLCAQAEKDASYLGCEYWATNTPTTVKSEFQFAVVISNPHAFAAQVQVRSAAEPITESDAFALTERIEGHSTKTLNLPWRGRIEGSPLLLSSAFHIESSVPVNAYQFNPLDYRHDRDCRDREADEDPKDGKCFSYSADASLLLPVPSLAETYYVMSYASTISREWTTGPKGDVLKDESGELLNKTGTLPGSFSVVATKDDTRVTVHPSTEVFWSGQVHGPGQSFTIDLDAGDVAHVLARPRRTLGECKGRRSSDSARFACGSDLRSTCTRHAEFCQSGDISGTKLEASQPVAAYGGAPCSFVPFDRYACDHLEESLPPLQTWGSQVVVGLTHALRDEPNIIRILSGSDDNELTFEPASISATKKLQAGEVLELTASESFVIQGTAPLLVAQYLVGQSFKGLKDQIARSVANKVDSGDPSMSIVAPVEQWRTDYDFLTPSTYSSNWITVTAPSTAKVRVDGKSVAGWKKVGGSEYVTAHVELAAGSHRIDASAEVAVQVYGFGEFTSYMFPAGLSLRAVNTPD